MQGDSFLLCSKRIKGYKERETDKQMEHGHQRDVCWDRAGLSTMRSTRDGRVTENSLEVMLNMEDSQKL